MLLFLSLFGTTGSLHGLRGFSSLPCLVFMGGSQFMDYDNLQCTLGKTITYNLNSQLDYWNSEKLKHAEIVFRYCTCSYMHVPKPAFFKGCSCVLHIHIYIHTYIYTHIYIYTYNQIHIHIELYIYDMIYPAVRLHPAMEILDTLPLAAAIQHGHPLDEPWKLSDDIWLWESCVMAIGN